MDSHTSNADKPEVAATKPSEARPPHTPRENALSAPAAAVTQPDPATGEDSKKEPEKATLLALRFNKKSALWSFRDEQMAEQPSSATATPTPAGGGGRAAGSKTASAARPKSHATPKRKNENSAASATTSATRPNAETLADVLRAHREQQSAAGPVQATTVVKRDKKKTGDSATKTTPKPESKSTDGDAEAAKATPTKSTAAKEAAAPEPAATTAASPVEKPEEEAKKEAKKTPKRHAGTSGTAAHVTVARKKNKTKATSAAPAPPTVVTTVKADKSVEQLRALRTRGSAADVIAAGDSQSTEEADRVQSVVDEITDLLLSYCRGEDRAVAPGDGAASPAAALPSLDDITAAKEEKKAVKENGDAPAAAAPAETAAAESGSTTHGATAEVQLYEKLVALCQREEVTPSTLELIRELVQHTRVIPQASRQNASAETAVISRRREYVQQIILVLLNQLRQQKIAEEVYGQQQHQQHPYMSSARSSPALPKSYLSSPMAPMVDQSAVLIAAATNRITLFNPQYSVTAMAPTVQTSASHDTTPFGTPQHHQLKATAEPFVPASQRSGTSQAGAPMIPSVIASSDISLTSSPSRAGGLVSGSAPIITPSPFPGAFPIIMGAAATPPPPATSTVPVTLTEAERNVLRNVQQDFQQQQQHHQQVAPADEQSPILRRTPGHNESSSSLTEAQRTVFSKNKSAALFNESTATDSTTAASSNVASPAVATSSSSAAAASATMNVNAPAFVPGAGAAVPTFTVPQQTGAQPWASNETFAEYRKMMETFSQAQSLVRNLKKQQQMLAMASKMSGQEGAN